MASAARQKECVDAMALSQVTWQDVQQTPDDGKRREAVGGEGPVCRRVTDRLPVHVGDETLGEIDLGEVLGRSA